jgi:hypothetical protein
MTGCRGRESGRGAAHARFAESVRLHPAPAASFPATGVQTRFSLRAVELPTGATLCGFLICRASVLARRREERLER